MRVLEEPTNLCKYFFEEDANQRVLQENGIPKFL